MENRIWHGFHQILGEINIWSSFKNFKLLIQFIPLALISCQTTTIYKILKLVFSVHIALLPNKLLFTILLAGTVMQDLNDNFYQQAPQSSVAILLKLQDDMPLIDFFSLLLLMNHNRIIWFQDVWRSSVCLEWIKVHVVFSSVSNSFCICSSNKMLFLDGDVGSFRLNLSPIHQRKQI